MSDQSPNIVWVTLESVRADHTSVHGYSRRTTPNLERIANDEQGAAFDNCFSQSMWTPASSASILSGTYLTTHKVGLDGKAEQPLPEHLDTFPNVLSENGFETACLTPNAYLSSATGLNKGFERFLWVNNTDLHKRRETIIPLFKYLARIRSYGNGFTTDGRKHNLTYPMMKILDSWTESLGRSDDPVFLYTHCPNPHHPYVPPRKYVDRFLDDTTLSTEEAIERCLDVYRTYDHLNDTIRDGCDLTDDEWAALKGLYDAEIAYADEFVGRLFDQVQSRFSGETIFVVTGDHGDLFGDHGVIGHNYVLDDGLTNVPLVTHGLDTGDAERDDMLQHIDVTNTLANVVGHPHDQFEGRDLRTDDLDFAISQKGYPDFGEELEQSPYFDVDDFHHTPLTAVRTREYKYLESSEKRELFALPDEETDVIDSHPEIADELHAVLKRTIDNPHPVIEDDAPSAEFTDEMKSQLSDLGYL
jgi:uncharacterized sulfatase